MVEPTEFLPVEDGCGRTDITKYVDEPTEVIELTGLLLVGDRMVVQGQI